MQNHTHTSFSTTTAALYSKKQSSSKPIWAGKNASSYSSTHFCSFFPIPLEQSVTDCQIIVTTSHKCSSAMKKGQLHLNHHWDLHTDSSKLKVPVPAVQVRMVYVRSMHFLSHATPFSDQTGSTALKQW